MPTLTPLLASTHAATHPQNITELALAELGFDALADLSPLVNLRKLSLKANALDNDALTGLSHNAAITTLDLQGNKLESFEGLDKLHKLIALNVSSNDINRLSVHLLHLQGLKALVAGHNRIARIENLGKCSELGTLVLSHNKISELANIASLTNLVKLAASHNPIRLLPDLSANRMLKELRLSGCKILRIPETIRGNPALEVIDLGSNLLSDFGYVTPIFVPPLAPLCTHIRLFSISDIVNLASLPNLVNLTLRGNPIASDPNYDTKIKALLPTLRILDGVRFDPRFVKNKQKREALGRKKAEPSTMARPSRAAAGAPVEASPRRGSADAMDVDPSPPSASAAPVAAAKDTTSDKSGRRERVAREPTAAGAKRPRPEFQPRLADGAHGSAATDGAAAPPPAKRRRVADGSDAAPTRASETATATIAKAKSTSKDAKGTATTTKTKGAPTGTPKPTLKSATATAGKQGKKTKKPASSRPMSAAGRGLASATSLSASTKGPSSATTTTTKTSAPTPTTAALPPMPAVTGVVKVEVVAKPAAAKRAEALKKQFLAHMAQSSASSAADEGGLGVGGWD
ncbi:hypothetical protein BC828DRAFT_270722 [Blastocladiella britannica]|nr:hypothetical protein BC828DRAFT_270722 [Blastocladiella britannica]